MLAFSRQMKDGAVSLKGKLKRLISRPEFVDDERDRSLSDDGYYVKAVRQACVSQKKFEQFKRDPDYRTVLEHVSEEQGRQYLDVLNTEAPDFVDQVEGFKANDRIGNPILATYDKAGSISPTTLRYMKVASDIRKTFGCDEFKKVAEVGVGYGGQLLTLDAVLKIGSYRCFDLPDVLVLVSKYLQSHAVRTSCHMSALDQFDGQEELDLVISNYAFSELPRQIQTIYIEKVLAKATRGYLTMNTGRGGNPPVDALPLAELETLLPPFEVLEENPLTAPHNYMIIWGH